MTEEEEEQADEVHELAVKHQHHHKQQPAGQQVQDDDYDTEPALTASFSQGNSWLQQWSKPLPTASSAAAASSTLPSSLHSEPEQFQQQRGKQASFQDQFAIDDDMEVFDDEYSAVGSDASPAWHPYGQQPAGHQRPSLQQPKPQQHKAEAQQHKPEAQQPRQVLSSSYAFDDDVGWNDGKVEVEEAVVVSMDKLPLAGQQAWQQARQQRQQQQQQPQGYQGSRASPGAQAGGWGSEGQQQEDTPDGDEGGDGDEGEEDLAGHITQPFVRSLFKQHQANKAVAQGKGGPKGKAAGGAGGAGGSAGEPSAAELERLRQLDEELAKVHQVGMT